MREEKGVTLLPAKAARGVRRAVARPARVGEGSAPLIREPAWTEEVRDWCFADVEARMVEAVTFWWRMPGSGGSPFAADGPWHLIQAEWGDYADLDAPAPRVPLSRAQIARMQATTEWLLLAPERDRPIVAKALRQLAAGAKRVDWMKMRRAMGVNLGADGLRMRYSRAITAICKALNAAGNRDRTASTRRMCGE